MSESKNWIEREALARQLSKVLYYFKKGHAQNTILLGPPKSGKSSLISSILEKQKETHNIIIDLNTIGMSPESFSIEFVGSILHTIYGEKNNYLNFLNLNFLLSLKNKLSERSYEIVKSLHNETLKIKPDQKAMIQSAFNILTTLPSKNIVITLNNFENILDLNNFQQIKNIVPLLNIRHKHILFLLTSSTPTLIRKHFKGFNIIEVNNLTLKETNTVLSNYGIKDQHSIDKLYKLTNGNPLLLSSVLKTNEKDIADIEMYLIEELIRPDGLLYNFCNSLYDFYLKRTPGQTLSKIILKVISLSPGLRLSEIAKKIYRSAPVTKSLIERLISSDIIYKRENKYYLQNSTLAIWLASNSKNLTPEHENIIKEVKNFYER